MSRDTRLMAGLILVVVPTIELGGSFLLAALIDRDSGYMTNALRQNFFRAGHAHAGILISGGFFFSVAARDATEPGRAIVLIYAGAVLLAASVLSLGIGLLRAR